MGKSRNRDWRGSVRSHKGRLLIAFKEKWSDEWSEASTLLDDTPENWAKAREMVAARRAEWIPPTPRKPPAVLAAEYRGIHRNSLNKSFKRRRGEACEVCGWTPRPPLRSSAVNAHHVRPRAEGGDHSDDNRIVLCPNHHAVAHALHRLRPAANRDDLVTQIREWEAAA